MDQSHLELDRSTFDSLFNLLALSSESRLVEDGTEKFSKAWSDLKALYLLTVDRDWSLSTEQLRITFEAGLAWEAVRNSKWLGRLKLSREAGQELEPLGVPRKEATRRGQLERIRKKLMSRLDKTAAQIKRDKSLDIQYAILVRNRDSPEDLGSPSSKRSYLIALDSAKSLRSSMSSLIRHFETGELRRAHSLLHKLIDNKNIPTSATFNKIFSNRSAVAVDTYDEARKILDSSSTSSRGNSAEKDLDALLQQRLDKIEQDEWRLAQPKLAFIKWIALEQPTTEVTSLEWSFLALRLWESIYASKANTESRERPISFLAHQLLSQLITATCNFESDTNSNFESYNRGPSLALVKATALASSYLNDSFLLSVSHRLLNATTITSPSPILARNLYYTLRTKLPPDESRAFLWDASLRNSFTYLFKTAAVSTSQNHDPTFAIQLYLDFTADGLTLPIGLWDLLWKALGSRGSVEETSRVLADYDQLAKVTSSDYGKILGSSAKSGRIVKTLRLLELVNKRADAQIRIETYDTIMELLASSYQDRRPDALIIFHSILAARIRPTISTWNALLANYVFRPRITMKDLDGSGKVYNSIITAGVKPNRITYSLLIHGFLRIASEGEKLPRIRNFGIEAAYNTFEKAISTGNLVRGWQVGKLVEGLGKAGNWEKAKGVGESWWKLNLSIESSGKEEAEDREYGEENYLIRAAERVTNWERAGSKEILSEPNANESEAESPASVNLNDDDDRVSSAAFPLDASELSGTRIRTFTPNSMYRS